MNRILETSFAIARKNALRYPTLNKFLDWNTIRTQLLDSKSKQTQNEYIPINVFGALLCVDKKLLSAYDSNSNLSNLETSLKKILPVLSEKDILEIKHKLSNLGNTSFWDTATELWFAAQLKESDYNIKFDYPLRESKKGKPPPNADVAIIGKNNEPIWLFDCTTPTLELDECKDMKLIGKEDFFDEPEKAIDCLVAIIKKKYENKFLPNIDYYPNARYGIIVTLTKADEISAHFITLNYLFKKTPIQIDSKKYQLHSKLKYAVAGRFQEVENKIEFVELLNYNAP